MTAIGMDLTLRARSLLVVNQRRDVAKRTITCCGSKILGVKVMESAIALLPSMTSHPLAKFF